MWIFSPIMGRAVAMFVSFTWAENRPFAEAVNLLLIRFDEELKKSNTKKGSAVRRLSPDFALGVLADILEDNRTPAELTLKAKEMFSRIYRERELREKGEGRATNEAVLDVLQSRGRKSA